MLPEDVNVRRMRVMHRTGFRVFANGLVLPPGEKHVKQDEETANTRKT